MAKETTLIWTQFDPTLVYNFYHVLIFHSNYIIKQVVTFILFYFIKVLIFIYVFLSLGGSKVKICGLVQYLNLFGVAIGYTIASSISMM